MNTFLKLIPVVCVISLTSLKTQGAPVSWTIGPKKFKDLKAEQFFATQTQIEFVETVGEGRIEQAQAYLDKGAKVNIAGRDGITPLLWTLLKLNKKGFKYLLEKGANANAIAQTGIIPEISILGTVAVMKDPDYLKLALAFKGNPNFVYHPNQQTIIFLAIRLGPIENVVNLIKARANINHQGKSGYTPLISGAFDCNYQAVYLLLESGADPNIKTKKGIDLVKIINTFGTRGLTSTQLKYYKMVVSEMNRRGFRVNPI